MAKTIKKKKTFGTVGVDRFSPAFKDGSPRAINVFLSFEDALKLHLGLGHILQHLNTYDRSTKTGRDAAVNLCVFTGKERITINEGKIR